MMTKTKLDTLLEDLKSDEGPITLNENKLEFMVDKALSFPQDTVKKGNVFAFPQKMAFGGGALGLLAAMLLVVLNLPVNQKSFQPVLGTFSEESASFDDMPMEEEDMIDMFLLENLEA